MFAILRGDVTDLVTKLPLKLLPVVTEKLVISIPIQ